MSVMQFNNEGKLILPKGFITESEKERKLRIENERRERIGKIRKKAINFGDSYTDNELKKILLINNYELEIEDIAIEFGRTFGAIKWILDHRDYYKKYNKIKTSNNLETNSFIRQIKRLIDSNK